MAHKPSLARALGLAFCRHGCGPVPQWRSHVPNVSTLLSCGELPLSAYLISPGYSGQPTGSHGADSLPTTYLVPLISIKTFPAFPGSLKKFSRVCLIGRVPARVASLLSPFTVGLSLFYLDNQPFHRFFFFARSVDPAPPQSCSDVGLQRPSASSQCRMGSSH